MPIGPGNVQLTYAQLEQLWIQNGGNASMAPLMAAIAMAESSGQSANYNPTDNNGTQTSWGLWQISDGTHNMPNGWNDPNTNAQMAIAKLNSQGLGAWGTYTSGAYQQYYQPNTPPQSFTLAGLNNPSSPAGNAPAQGVPLTPGASNKCVWHIGIGPVGTCLWYESWTHGILGVVAIVSGSGIILTGLALLGLSTTTGKKILQVAPIGRAKSAGAIAGGQSLEGEAIAAEQKRMYRQQVRTAYRESVQPTPTVQQQAVRGEQLRRQRRAAIERHRVASGSYEEEGRRQARAAAIRRAARRDEEGRIRGPK